MGHKIVKICDVCGKETKVEKVEHTGFNWFRLEKIKLFYRVNDISIHTAGKLLDINESTDPDFCSEKCLIDWLKKEMKELKKPGETPEEKK